MSSSRRRLATLLASSIAACLLVPGVVAAKEPPKFPTQGTDALAKNSWIVTLKRGEDLALAARISKKAGGKVGLTYSHALHGFQFKGSANAAAALAKNPRVKSVTPDHAVYLTEIVPNGISRIHAWSFSGPTQGAYQAGFTGAGARIAILDTGIDLAHPDLAASIDNASGKNCLNSTLPPQDGHGHGTHVSGTAAAPLNGEGVVGVAPEATLVAIKMFDDAGNSSEALSLCALDRVIQLNSDASSANDIDVASMSWGEHRAWGDCSSDPLHGAICTARASGAILVAGAGNEAVDAGDFVPAAFPEVISVSALSDFDGEPERLGGCQFVPSLFWYECDDTMAFFSDYGPSVDVIAPGVNVNSTWTGGGYMTIDGTSMATPHVAGVVALMRAEYAALTAAVALDILVATGECPNGQAANADGTAGCGGQGTWPDDPDGIAEPLPNALRAAQAASNLNGGPSPTAPGAPTLNAATPGNAQVTLTWSAPASNGGSPITGYTATASPGGATCSTTGTTTCTVTGLTNGTSYSFTVRATNVAGTGSPSNALAATPRTVPGAPRNLTAAPHKAKGVNLGWAAPLTNGGAAITGYRIYRRTAAGSLVQVASVGPSTLSYRDAATTKGTQYFYVVRATNAAGEGASSNEAGAIAK
jgi:subtilisin